MAALFGAVIGFRLDDAGRQPVPVDPVADHLAEQFAGQQLGVTIEETIAQRAGARPGQT